MTIFKSTRTLLCAGGMLLTSILTACGGGSDAGRDPILGIPAAALVSVSVTPANATVLVGASQQFTATANYSDGSARNVTTSSAWVSATPAVATVGAATGLAVGVIPGSAVVSATFESKAGSGTLVVTAPPPPPAPTLSSIAVTPAVATIGVGATQQYNATATYSNGFTAVVTNNVIWTSSSTSVGTVAASGLATGVAVGTTTITASSGATSANALLNVIAGPVLPPPPPPVVPPVVPGAPLLDLGRATSFAVLAGTAITNNAGGSTLVTGDVGSPSQTVDPVQAAGFTNYKSGAILDGALADLQVAISNANNRPCTESFASGIDLGGLTRGPGVYCYAGSINITGTFTMKGPGLYIFRTGSTLNATANAIVRLEDGAIAENVFWVPVGPTTLGANGEFKGSILGQSAAITVGDMTTLLNGRVLSAAAVTLRNNKTTK